MLGVLTCMQSLRWQSLTHFELTALRVRIQLARIFMLLSWSSFIWLHAGCLALNVKFFSPWAPVTSAEAWQFCSVSGLRLVHPALPDHWQLLVALACKLRWPENCGSKRSTDFGGKCPLFPILASPWKSFDVVSLSFQHPQILSGNLAEKWTPAVQPADANFYWS